MFRADVISLLNGIAWWAVMLFVFIAGVELDLKKAWRHRAESVTRTAGIELAFVLGVWGWPARSRRSRS